MKLTIIKIKYIKNKKYSACLFRANLNDNNSREVKDYG